MAGLTKKEQAACAIVEDQVPFLRSVLEQLERAAGMVKDESYIGTTLYDIIEALQDDIVMTLEGLRESAEEDAEDGE